MRPLRTALASLVVLSMVACSDDDSGEPADTEPPAATDGDTGGADSDAGSEGADSDAGADAPSTSPIVVEPVGLTDDRVVRRGGSGWIVQGQTFVVESDTTLESVTFTVVPEAGIGAGDQLALNLYEVADPELALPSAPVDLGTGSEPLLAELPADVEIGTATDITFTLGQVPLTGGTTYAVTLSLPEGAEQGELYVQHADFDAYPDGLAIRFEGSSWKADRVVGDQAIVVVFGT